jgi:mRNA interferase MazF
LACRPQSHSRFGTNRNSTCFDISNRFTTTVLTIPFTTNLRRASLPSCVQISAGEGGLTSDSVALCHQLRVLDKTRLTKKLGKLSGAVIAEIEECALFTLGYEN